MNGEDGADRQAGSGVDHLARRGGVAALLREKGGEPTRIHPVPRSLDIHEKGAGAEVDHGAGGGEEGERDRDHSVPRPDTEGPEGKEQGIGARSHPHGVPHPAVVRDLLLKRRPLGAQDEALALEYGGHRRLDLVLEGRVLGPQI